MKETKVKWIGIFTIAMVAFIHSYLFINAIRGDISYRITKLDFLDVLIPFTILFSIVFGQKVGKMILINTSDHEICMARIKKVLRKIVLSTIMICLFIISGKMSVVLFIMVIIINYILIGITAFIVLILLELIKAIFIIRNK
jgi:hypothetical protein